MKNTCFAIWLFALASSLVSETLVYPNQLHVPVGFDSNDEVQVILTKLLPDTCHKLLTSVKVTGDQIIVDMKEEKSSRKTYCIQAMHPYMVSVPVGKLNPGTYKVVSSDNKGKALELVVGNPSSTSIDNFTYANVTNVERTENDTIILTGEHPTDCMTLEEVQVIPNDTKDTLSILPITTTVNEVCNLVMTPFSIEVPLFDIAKNAVFHVRKPDGTFMNFQ